MLDYRLHVFRTVVDHKNISAAARRLHISQPAVTKHIQTLEEEFGVTLLVRSSSGISLTETGYILLDHALRISDLDNDVAQKLGQNRGELWGTLRLGASTTITHYYLPSPIVTFLGRYPKVKLSLIDGNAEEIIGALLSHKIDLGLIEGPCKNNGIKSRPFFQDEIICVVGKNHPLSSHTVISPSTLAKYPIIEREAGSGTRFYVEQALRKIGIKIEKMSVIMDIPSSEAIKRVVAAGLGVGFLSKLSIPSELKTGELREIRVKGLKIIRPFLLLNHQGPMPGGPANAFFNTLQSIT